MVDRVKQIVESFYGVYETPKERRRYISRSHKGYDKIKLSIYDYVLGLTSSVNDYLRNNDKWNAVTKYLDIAFEHPTYGSNGIIDIYGGRLVVLLKNV